MNGVDFKKIAVVLYYKYIIRQTIITTVVLLVVISIINAIFFSVIFNKNEPNKITNDELIPQIFVLLLWIFGLWFLIVIFYYFVLFKKFKKQLEKNSLSIYLNIKNSTVRQCIVNSNLRIYILFPRKNQLKYFCDTLFFEIKKQYNLLKIKEGDF